MSQDYGNDWVNQQLGGTSSPTILPTPSVSNVTAKPTTDYGNDWVNQQLGGKPPVDTSTMFSKSSVTPEVKKSIPDNSTLGVIKNTITGLPKAGWDFLGVGKIQDYLNTPEGQEAAMNLGYKDVAKSIVPAATQFVGTPIADVAGIVTGPKTYKIPSIFGDTEITNIQKQTSDAIQNGENPYIAVLNATPQAIFDGLMIAGLSQKVFSPRESVVATGYKPATGEVINAKTGLREQAPIPVKNKSFRLTSILSPESTQSRVPNNAIDALAKEQGIKITYDPKQPSFFRQTTGINGKIKGEIVQLKPSLFNEFVSKFRGNINNVPDSGLTVIHSEERTLTQIKENLGGEKAPIVPDLHPTLVEETAGHIKNEGVDATHQALQEHLGATPEQASHIIDKGHEYNRTMAIENPEASVAESVGKSEVATIKPSPISTDPTKYASAEEYVKARTNAYHGTPNKEFAEFKLDAKRNSENETNGLGVWVTNSPEAAKIFSNKIENGMFSGSTLKDVGGTVMPVSVNLKNPKIYTSTKGMESILGDIEKLRKEKPSIGRLQFESDPNIRQQIIDKRDTIDNQISKLKKEYQRDAFEHFMDDRDQFANYINKGAKWEERYVALDIPKTNKQFIDYLKKQGHDGIIIKGTEYDAKKAGLDAIDQIVSFEPSKVLTKSQLTAEWNKANEKQILDSQLTGKLKDGDVLVIGGKNYTYEKETDITGDIIEKLDSEKMSDNWLNINREKGKIVIDDIYGDVVYTLDTKSPRGSTAGDISKGADTNSVPLATKTGREYTQPLSDIKKDEVTPTSKTLTIKSSTSAENTTSIAPKQLLSKTDVKDILKGVSKKEISMNVTENKGNKVMHYKDGKNEFNLRPSALGILEDNINIGDTLKISIEDLKEKGTTFRAFDKNNKQAGFINIGQMVSDLASPVTEFLKQDVLPKTKIGVEGLRNTMDGILHVIAPTKGVKATDLDQIMKMKGAQDKAEFIFAETHKIISNSFDKMPQKEKVDFIDRMKTGKPQATEALQIVADGLRKIDTALWEQAKEFKPSLSWKENHFRVMWKVVPGNPEALGFKGIFKKPLQGTKGFARQSTLTDMSEGIAKGGVPISYNPIELFQYAYSDINKFITAQKMIREFKENGQMQFRKSGKFPDNGFVRLNDSLAKVYMPVETSTGGTVITSSGEWYIEENVGRILNNYLSKDHIRSSDMGRGLLAIKNLYTAVELSLSPFHAIFESLETMGSQMGLGIQQITSGQFGRGLKNITTSPISPYTTAKIGGDALRFLTKTGPEGDILRTRFIKQYPDAGRLLNDLFSAGGRLKIDSAYKLTTIKTFKENIGNKNYIGATLRALPALSQKITEPLFDIYIPRLKVGTFLNEYSNDLVENAKALAEGTVTRETLARTRWNFVEDRFGEMNFDNLFWNKTFKTSMQLMFRSVTWKMGNLRATGGAMWGQGAEFYNAAKEGRAPKLNPKMSWLLGMSVITVIMGTILQKSLADKNPQSIKDIIYPQIDDKGNRISTPTYWKDVFHLVHNPVGYVTSSMSGIISKVLDVWNNRDFYGVEIHNPNDSFLKQMEDNIIHLTPTPFAVSSTISLNKSGASLDKQTLGFFGFTKAPGYISQDKTETAIFEVFQRRLGAGVISKEDADIKTRKSDIIKEYQNGNPDKANEMLDKAVADGIIKDTNAFIKKADFPGEIRAFRALPTNDQYDLLSKMSETDIEKYGWFVNKDLLDPEVFSEISDNAKKFIEKVNNSELTEPTYSQGAIIAN